MPRPDRSTPVHAGAGILATAAGIAAGHLTAALIDPASSPVLAVGSQVIDLTPTPMKEWAVREFGTADKPILVGSVMLGALLLAALAGILTRRSLGLGLGLLLGLVTAAGATAALRPAAGPLDVLPAVAAAVVGASALIWLVRGLDGRSSLAARPPNEAGGRAGRAPASPVPLGGRAGRAPASPAVETPTTSRRTVLVGSGLVALAAVAMGTAGQWISSARTRISDIVLPAAAEVLPPLPTGLETTYEGISALQTPNREFYRVDINLTVPVVDVPGYRLLVDGDVERELRLSFDDLAAMPLIERDITMTCVSNEVGGGYVGSARWLGVPLTEILDRAAVGGGADQILSTAVDGFTISTPLEVATDGRDAMVVIGMNGEPLPREHGFPVRLITPGVYGFVGATKWLTGLTLTTYADRAAYWTERDWATDAPVKISSRIDTPRPLSRIEAGRQVIGGVAWAQTRGIDRVEVRIDGGAWRPATLGPDVGADYWRQWYLPWDAEPGQHLLAVRARGLDGEVQTAVRASPFPAGSSGIQEIVVTVRA